MKEKRFKKIKQILAIAGIVLLLALYGAAFLAAIFDSSESQNVFMAAICATILIPTLLWIYMYIYKLLKK